MCGIAGYAGQGSSESLRRMARAIERRGPDDEGFYESSGVGFAFRRLSIIDVQGGHQPLSNEDGSVWVMLNGEIYGFDQTRDELLRAGHQFKTKSDTEVIAHAYEEWGDECFKHLSGMFAIAIWDATQSRLVLARDRLGKKPLYWTVKDGTLWFGSELKALIAAGVVNRDIDLTSLGLYFRTDSVPTPQSIFKGVSKLEPASAMSWSNGKIEKRWNFWECPRERQENISSREAIDGLRTRLDQAVKERLVSDVPLGLFLSGGLDSSVIAESAARQSNTKMRSFTIGFDDASHDERGAARSVAKALDLDHAEEMLTTKQALAMMDEATELLDEPLADAAILPQLLLAQFTRKHVTVALSGDGGDELLLGYQHIPAHILVERLSFVPPVIRGAVAKLLNLIPSGTGYFSPGFKAQRFARGLPIDARLSRDLAWRGSFTQQGVRQLLLPQIPLLTEEGLGEELWSRPIAPPPARQSLRMLASTQQGGESASWRAWSWAYLRTYLLDDVLVKVDRATMWYALEARAPILDEEVVSYLMSLPDEYKLGAWKGKRLFKELLRDRIPSEILNRPKHGFGVPVARWLKNELRPELERFAVPAYLIRQGLFEPQAVRRLMDEHIHGRTDRRRELWAYLMFQRWYGRWM